MFQTASLSTKEEPGPQGLLLAPVPVQLMTVEMYLWFMMTVKMYPEFMMTV